MFTDQNLKLLTDTEDYQLINDKYPHIGNKMALSWGFIEFNEYMSNLLLDDRDGKRTGFPYTDLQAIIRLIELHKLHYPEFTKRDIWDKAINKNIR